jgi:2-phospho-L-lactate guanylyltransferase (CobY/MobA/RfbA family)
MRVVERAGLALDVDEPGDLRAAWAAGPGAHTRRALEEIGFASREVS